MSEFNLSAWEQWASLIKLLKVILNSTFNNRSDHLVAFYKMLRNFYICVKCKLQDRQCSK